MRGSLLAGSSETPVPLFSRTYSTAYAASQRFGQSDNDLDVPQALQITGHGTMKEMFIVDETQEL